MCQFVAKTDLVVHSINYTAFCFLVGKTLYSANQWRNMPLNAVRNFFLLFSNRSLHFQIGMGINLNWLCWSYVRLGFHFKSFIIFDWKKAYTWNWFSQISPGPVQRWSGNFFYASTESIFQFAPCSIEMILFCLL